MLLNLGLVALAAGDLPGSRARFIEGLRIAKQDDNRLAQSSFLRLLGGQAVSSGNPRLAARLLGAAEAIGVAAGAGTTGPAGPSRLEPELARVKNAALTALGAAKYEMEYAAGKGLSREDALRLALGEPGKVPVDANKPVEAGPLSKRELEVAGLIAESLSDKEIATRLFISDRTVTTHVGNILNKLGFDSRVQIARWIAATGS